MGTDEMGEEPPRRVWTVGHSSRPWDEFLALLFENGIQAIADVRRFPGSRAHPQFGCNAFEPALREAGIDYRWFEALGGRRRLETDDAANAGWRVTAFRAYADYTSTDPFVEALDVLEDVAGAERTAVMCAEALPTRCHRRLIADALTVRGWEVLDIVGPRRIEVHALPSFARMDGVRLTYPAEQTGLFTASNP